MSQKDPDVFVRFSEDLGPRRAGFTYREPLSFLLREVAPTGRAVVVKGCNPETDDDALRQFNEAVEAAKPKQADEVVDVAVEVVAEVKPVDKKKGK